MVHPVAGGDDVISAPRKSAELRQEIESASQQSVDEGCCGVLVERPVTGSNLGWRVHASHPDVPLGFIHERPISSVDLDPPPACRIDRDDQ